MFEDLFGSFDDLFNDVFGKQYTFKDEDKEKDHKTAIMDELVRKEVMPETINYIYTVLYDRDKPVDAKKPEKKATYTDTIKILVKNMRGYWADEIIDILKTDMSSAYYESVISIILDNTGYWAYENIKKLNKRFSK